MKNKQPEINAVIGPEENYGSVTQTVSGIVFEPVRRGWIFGFFAAFALLMLLVYAVSVLFARGIGIWGINIPVAWGFDIINFVWWIGIGHAGTFISAILLLLKQDWRTSINRAAEAMTLFAVMCAGMYPLIHLGRPQYFYWITPYPNTMSIWPQFRSPLVWDFFAVMTYFTVSLMFWYVGLIPDLGTMRDRAERPWVKKIFAVFSWGWRGASRHWYRYETAYLILAGLSTPLVLSVHSVVSLDFAAAVLPGWHSAIFPPYFVAGAIFSGFAMVMTLVIPVRRFYGLKHLITRRHLENMAKVILATGLMVSYGYLMEWFMAWYSGNPYERFMMANRAGGPYGFLFWGMIFCNVVAPLVFCFKWARTHIGVLFVVSLLVNVGMWLERFVIIVVSLHREFLTSSWGMYIPTRWDWATYAGSIGLFLTLFYLFIRFVPMIAMSEVKMLVHEQKHPPEPS